ncbi:MAG: hypothetical protein ACLQVL_33090 [Terriglobia bacterium]
MPVADITVHPDQTVRITSPAGFPVREDVAFTNLRGAERGSEVRWAKREIKKLQEPLRKILEPGEVVLYLARGQIMPGKLQRYTQGTQSHYLAPAALILTNRRLLHLSLKWNGRWNRNLRSAHWGDVKEAHVTSLLYGRLHLEYRQGSKETYWRIPKNAAKKIQLLLDVLLPAPDGETSPALAMASFCPDCVAALSPGVYQCRQCGLKFKNGKTLLLHALLVPGGAYFYVGLDLFGVAHAAVDVAILSSMIVWALAAVGRVQPRLRAGTPATKFTYVAVVAFLLSALVFDVCMSIKVARNAIRTFIPNA